MKGIWAWVLIAALLAGAAGCAKPGAEKCVEEFCAAMQAYDVDKMESLVATPGTVFEDLRNEVELEGFFKEWSGKIQYEVGKAEKEGDKATVKVKFTFTDASKPFTEALTESISQAFAMAMSGTATEDDMAKLFSDLLEQKFHEGELPSTEAEIAFACIKSDGAWKIDVVPEDIPNVLMGNILKGLEEVEGEDAGTGQE